MKNIKSGNHGLYKFQYALELKLLSNLQLKVQNNDFIKNIVFFLIKLNKRFWVQTLKYKKRYTVFVYFSCLSKSFHFYSEF